VKERKNKRIETVEELKDMIFNNMNPRADRYKVLMRVFQALRIAINNELENLELFMEKILSPLRLNGIGIIITFHSLEHKIVARTLREMVKLLIEFESFF